MPRMYDLPQKEQNFVIGYVTHAIILFELAFGHEDKISFAM